MKQKQASAAGKSASPPAARKPLSAAGKQHKETAEYDRRGVKLPAKALVGGIITPQ